LNKGVFMTGLNRKVMLGLAVAALGLAGCASKGVNHAPVEERVTRAGNPSGPAIPTVPVVPVKQPQGFENAGKPGYYTVKPGDTLLRISMDNGQSMQDVARWSKVDNPNRIEVGQVLRVAPPIDGEGVVVRPVAKPAVVVGSASAPAVAASAAASSSNTSKPVAPEGEVNWLWPANGAVVAGFDEVKNKGLDIGGKAGDPVVAAADGRVVYVGAGLRGYGNLIILKHDNVFLTAYAHNQTLLVKEDQTVTGGQKIAEMGNSDADRVKLHFEVRRQGKPVDPAKYLPVR
jgi:lipoprotein NlpD